MKLFDLKTMVTVLVTLVVYFMVVAPMLMKKPMPTSNGSNGGA
tara:strand:+ start:11469 stop:11597 length:129 start_codon:yes stop_codon:yes gene_type:complete